ncbi:MAG: HEAT repeat domain-containing protein [Planctomycetota bacterium]|jgi:HEAT repeat protein
MQLKRKWIISITAIVLAVLVISFFLNKLTIAQATPTVHKIAVVATTTQAVSQPKALETAPQKTTDQATLKRIKELIEQLGSREEHVYKAAIEALAKIGQPVVQPLINVLETEENGLVRGWAAKVLGDTHDKRAVLPLSKALGDDRNPFVRQFAATALAQIGDKEAVQPLINALADEHWLVRTYAVRALGRIGDPQAVQPLINALEDQDKYVIQYAAEALGKIGDKQALQPLIEATKDESQNVRIVATKSLELIKSRAALEKPVNKIPQTKAEAVATTALTAKDEAPHKPIEVSKSQPGDEKPSIGKSDIETSGKVVDKQAVQSPVKASKDESKNVRTVATKALELINSSAVSEEQTKAAPQTQAEAVATATLTTADDAMQKRIEVLIRQLGDEKPSVRNSAIESLCKIGPPTVLPLINALEDEYWIIRWRASETLGRIGNLQAVQPLINALGDNNEWVRRRAAESLGLIGDEQAVQPLINALKDESQNVRTVATMALELIKSRDASEEQAKVAEEKPTFFKKYIGVEVAVLVLGGLTVFAIIKKKKLFSRQGDFSESLSP